MREYLRWVWSILLDLADAPARAAYDLGVRTGERDTWLQVQAEMRTLASRWDSTASISHDAAQRAALHACADELRRLVDVPQPTTSPPPAVERAAS